ncbi:MAG: hypothetical protein AAGE89_13270 [Pseudomonadota bacterium]
MKTIEFQNTFKSKQGGPDPAVDVGTDDTPIPMFENRFQTVQAVDSDQKAEQKALAPDVQDTPSLFLKQKDIDADIVRLKDAPLLKQWMETSPDGDLAETDFENLTLLELIADGIGGASRAAQRAFHNFMGLGDMARLNKQARIAQDKNRSLYEIEMDILSPEEEKRLRFHRHLHRELAKQEAKKRFDLSRSKSMEQIFQDSSRAFEDVKARQKTITDLKMSPLAEEFKNLYGAAGNTFSEKLDVIQKNPEKYAAYLAEMSIENMVPGLLFTTVGAVTRNPVAAGATAAAFTFAFESNNEALAFLMNSGRKMETVEDFQAILEDEELMAEAQRRGLFRGVFTTAVEILSRGLPVSDLVKSRFGSEAIKTIAGPTLSTAGEIGSSLAIDGTIDKGKAVLTGTGGLTTAVLGKAGSGARRLGATLSPTAKSHATARTLRQIGDIAALSKLRQAAPETFRDAAGFMFRGKPDIIISAGTMKTYLESKGFENSVVRDWGITPDVFEAKLATGGDVVISLTDYVTDIAGKPFDAFVQKNGRLDTRDFSLEEATRAISNLDGESQKLRMLSQKRDSPRAKRREASQRIEQDIRNNWRIAESVNIEAIGDTKAVSAFFTALGDRTGADPFDLYVRYRSKSGIGSDLARPAGRAGWLDGTDAPIIEAPDLTSFLARSSDAFLTLLVDVAKKDGPQSLKADVAAIRRLVGSEAGTGISRLHKEKWARGFRAYLLEGKAASPELARAFERQKDWLRELYQGQDLSKVDVSPEIRGMMNRILMSEAEVATARNDAGMAPLFEKDRPDGMTGAEAERYDSLANEARAKAETTLRAETMETVRRKNTGADRKERAEVQNEVAERVGNLPEYRLLDALSERRDSQRARNRVADLRLDSDQLVEMFGKGILQDLSRERLGGRRAIFRKGGEDIGTVAAAFGFRNGADMIETLRKTPAKADRITSETDRIMIERHTDPLTDGSLGDRARLAVHSEAQGALVVMEVQQLARQAGKPENALSVSAFQTRAKEMIADLPVRDVMRDKTFLQASERAARETETQLLGKGGKGGDTAAAFIAKERQALNHYLYAEARKARAEIEGKLEAIQRFGHPKTRRAIGKRTMAQIDRLLETHGLRAPKKRPVDHDESFWQFFDEMVAEGREAELVIPQSFFSRRKGVPYTKLSVTDLTDLFKAIDNLEHIGRRRFILKDRFEERSFDDVVTTLETAIAGGRGTFEAGDASAQTHHLNRTITIEAILFRLDRVLGGSDQPARRAGDVTRALKIPVDDALKRERIRLGTLRKELSALYGVYTAKERRAMAKPRYYPEIGRTLDRWSVIAIALQTGNQASFRRLTDPNVPGSLNGVGVQRLLQTLDERDWGVVQSIWDYLDRNFKEISAKEQRMTGVTAEKAESGIMVPAPGFVSGGYYPLLSDRTYPGRSGDGHADFYTRSLLGGYSAKAQTRIGQAQGGIIAANRKPSFSLDALHDHLAHVIHDLETGEAVAHSWRVLNDERVIAAFGRWGNAADHEALTLWLKEAATGNRPLGGGEGPLAAALRRGVPAAQLAHSLSADLVPHSTLARAASVVGKRDLALGVLDYLKNTGRWQADIAASSDFMRKRQAAYEQAALTAGNTGEPNGAIVRILAAKTQFFVVEMATFVAAYNSSLKRSGDEATALSQAERMVERAHGTSLLSGLDKRTAQLTKSFGALNTIVANRTSGARSEGQGPSGSAAIGYAGDLGLLFAFQTLLEITLKGFSPHRDDAFAEELAKEAGFYPFHPAEEARSDGTPLERDIASAFTGKLGAVLYGGGGEPSEIADFEPNQLEAFLSLRAPFFHQPSPGVSDTLEALLDDAPASDQDAETVPMPGLAGGGTFTNFSETAR